MRAVPYPTSSFWSNWDHYPTRLACPFRWIWRMTHRIFTSHASMSIVYSPVGFGKESQGGDNHLAWSVLSTSTSTFSWPSKVEALRVSLASYAKRGCDSSQNRYKLTEHATQTEKQLQFCPVCWQLQCKDSNGCIVRDGKLFRLYDVTLVVDYIF